MAGITFEDEEVLNWKNEADFLAFIEKNSGAAEHAAALGYSTDVFYLLIMAAIVFFMQAGFALVEVGSVSMKNTKNILTKNMLDACIGAISFWLVGYGFAFGDHNGFIGGSGFALKTLDGANDEFSDRLYDGKDFAFFLFQFAFAATAATIVSGAVAERCQIIAYFVYSFVLTIFVYPVVVHWGWSGTGWASAFVDEEKRLFGVGVIDFAGSTVVHMVGGLTALIGALFLGPRQGKYDKNGRVQAMPFQSTTFQTIGTLILWFGWYGFNCGSTIGVGGNLSDVAGKVAVTTTIAGTTSGVTATLLGRVFEGHIDVARTNNGILGGLVSITAGCSVVHVEIAFVIGIIGGFVYFGASKLLIKIHIDDVVDASPVHFFCGVWGTLAAGIFAEPSNVAMAYDNGSCGLFYKCNGNGPKQFAANLVFILAVSAWVGIFAAIIFGILKLFGLLRVSVQTEKYGLDVAEHGGSAYELTSQSPVRKLSVFAAKRATNLVTRVKRRTSHVNEPAVVIENPRENGALEPVPDSIATA